MRTSTETTDRTGTTAFRGRYLSLTSFRRDGTGVATPVWFVIEDGRFLVETDGDSYKVRRIRREPEVMIAPCSARGKLRAIPMCGHAEVLSAAEVHRVERLIGRKYRIEMAVFRPLRAILSRLHLGRPRGEAVVLAITPD